MSQEKKRRVKEKKESKEPIQLGSVAQAIASQWTGMTMDLIHLITGYFGEPRLLKSFQIPDNESYISDDMSISSYRQNELIIFSGNKFSILSTTDGQLIYQGDSPKYDDYPEHSKQRWELGTYFLDVIADDNSSDFFALVRNMETEPGKSYCLRFLYQYKRETMKPEFICLVSNFKAEKLILLNKCIYFIVPDEGTIQCIYSLDKKSKASHNLCTGINRYCHVTEQGGYSQREGQSKQQCYWLIDQVPQTGLRILKLHDDIPMNISTALIRSPFITTDRYSRKYALWSIHSLWLLHHDTPTVCLLQSDGTLIYQFSLSVKNKSSRDWMISLICNDSIGRAFVLCEKTVSVYTL